MNKFMHGIVLALFGLACWLVSIILRLPAMLAAGLDYPLPAFTRFCLALGPTLLLAAFGLALAYCLVVWVRKTDRASSWVAFLAGGMSAIVLLMFPMLIAIYLPLVDALHRLHPK